MRTTSISSGMGGRKYPKPSRGLAAKKRTSRGFALVSVIWGLGLVTLLAMALIAGARYRARTAYTESPVSNAAALAESAVNLAIYALLAGQPVPARCQMPDGSSVEIAAEDESGKIDLNAATSQVLETYFVALTRSKPLGSQIAANVERFRRPQVPPPETASATGGGASPQTKPGGFTTIMQLDLIDGLSPALFRAATRHTTVFSGRPEPLADHATPSLRALMGMKTGRGDADLPAVNGTFTVRADIRESRGARYVREALVTLGAGGGTPYLIREWRRGDVAPDARPPVGPLQDCLRIKPAGRTAS